MFLKLLLLSDEFSFNYEGLSTSPSRIASETRLIRSCIPPSGVSQSATFDMWPGRLKLLDLENLSMILPYQEMSYKEEESQTGGTTC